MDKNSLSRIRIKDIARLAGVSAGTVDRVLHKRGEVSDSTRKKILEIIEKLDYQPDILASLLAARKPCKFASLIPHATAESPFWDYPLTGIEQALNEIAHFGVSLDKYFFDYEDPDSFIRQSRKMLTGNPQGVILAPVYTGESAVLLDECNDHGIPVVLINANIFTGSCIAFIGQDSLQSGMVAAKLMHYGLRDDADVLIVNFTREKGNHDHILKREEGFRKYYRNFSAASDSRLTQLNIAESGSHRPDKILADSLLSYSTSAGGIFVTNSRVFRVAGFLEEHGLSNIILIGYDLLKESRDFLMKGTIDFLISQKPREQGYKSVMTLFRHLVLRKRVERSQYLPIDVITKENLEHYTFT